MPAIRQLAAIMFADIAGYSAMMQNDEEVALRMRNKFRQTLEEQSAAHGGRILELKGDGALCSFVSTIGAVKAALAIQLAMIKNPPVPLRIGIHAGDVVVDDNTAYGDGVNIASRIESFAVSGSIFLSGKVYDDIKNQKEFQTVSLGKYILKNVKEAMEIFAIANPGLTIPDPTTLKGKGEKVAEKSFAYTSILVLPFVNISNDADQEYFSDGLTEEIISRLSKLKNVRVISRTTSMLYKGTAKDLKTIGRETDSDCVLEGSVRKVGNDLRITAQFIEAMKDIHLWAETYRGQVGDIFDIQEKVSEKIVEALRIQLTREERVSLEKRYTDDTEAYEHYLKGRFYWKQGKEESFKIAIAHFEKALEKDPSYALAWAGLADTYNVMGEYTNISRRALYPKQLAAVNTALLMDSRLAEAHISLGISLMLNAWDWKNALRELLLGIELSPQYATGHHWYGMWLFFNGKVEEAFLEISLALELDPASPNIIKDKGIFHYYIGEYSQALGMGMMALNLDVEFSPAYRLLSLSYAGMKRYNEATTENQRWEERTGNKVKSTIALAEIQALAGHRAEAEKLLTEVIENNIFSSNDFRAIAMVYVALGEVEMVFPWLEKSLANHEESLCSIKVDKKWDPLRSDPRFQSLVEKIGL